MNLHIRLPPEAKTCWVLPNNYRKDNYSMRWRIFQWPRSRRISYSIPKRYPRCFPSWIMTAMSGTLCWPPSMGVWKTDTLFPLAMDPGMVHLKMNRTCTSLMSNGPRLILCPSFFSLFSSSACWAMGPLLPSSFDIGLWGPFPICKLQTMRFDLLS